MPELPDVLVPLTRDPSVSAVVTDYDGTIADIVDDPAAAMPDPLAREALVRCVDHFGVVAVVSGRLARDVAQRLEVPGLMIVGSYGLETIVDDVHAVDPRVSEYAGAVAAAARDAERRLDGVRVERKEDIGVALHWRTTPEREQEIRAVADELASVHGLHLMFGKCVAELRTPIDVDKGTAVASLVPAVRHACFAGDDRGDLLAFEALQRAWITGELETAVRIGVHSAEAPSELDDSVDLMVDGPAALGALFGAIAAA